MNHCVPEFNIDDDYSIPSSSAVPRQKNMQEDEIMELLWQNGQVVLQSQNPRSHRKSPPPPPQQTKLSHRHQQPPSATTTAPPPTSDSSTHLFMQEDEMVSWLQYPLEDPSFDRDLTDLFYNQASRQPPPNPTPSSAAPSLKPPLPPPPSSNPPPIPTRSEAPPTGVNFPHFSRIAPRIPETRPSTSSIRNNDPRESTVVDSSDTPAMEQKSKIYPPRSAVEVSGGGNRGCNSLSGGVGGCMSVSMSRDGETCELTLTSSPDGSGASASSTATADLMTLPPAYDRERKGREPVDDATTEYQSEYAEIESYEAKRQARGGTGTKRSRAAEVHNLSERRRRDRINEKMKALQELIPRCSKTDKASMLDEAIEYLKSLQLQVQMMSMGCGMVPVMFPGVQQYMPSMGMGMGMGMGMDMGMARPMMQFPAVLSGSALPTPGAPSHLNPRFPLQTFPMQPIPGPDPSRIQQASHQADAWVNPLRMSVHSMARIPNLADPYQQQCKSLQQMQMQMQIPQNQPTSQPSSCKPSTSRGRDEDNEKHPSG